MLLQGVDGGGVLTRYLPAKALSLVNHFYTPESSLFLVIHNKVALDAVLTTLKNSPDKA